MSDSADIAGNAQAADHFDARGAAACFALPGALRSLAPLGNGNVNSTYRVECDGPAGPQRFVLQRLNTAVFPRPDRVMANLAAMAEHVAARLEQGVTDLAGRRWEVPRVVPVRADGALCLKHGGGIWRMITFVEGATSRETLSEPGEARELGFALGMFHRLIADLAPERLADTLEGFHVTPRYLAQFDALLRDQPQLEATAGGVLAEALAFVEARRELVPVLERALASGLLRLRPIHGDPKVNNVLFDTASGEAIGLVDLDTVKPGLLQWDIGDALRSGCNRLGEETQDLAAVQFDLQLAEAVLAGYLQAAGAVLEPADIEFLYPSIRLIAFELGLRFLSDHLAGDVYFRTRHRGHNLERALVQFRLTESIEAQESRIRAIIEAAC
ncbi:MAG: phosphotransferase [Synechococcaceae cyanobacterium]|nr:phosphotransferase [Synechococcaceae cyanobacterium]